MVEGGLKRHPLALVILAPDKPSITSTAFHALILYIHPPPSIDSAYDLYIWTRPVIPTFYPTPSFVENLLFERPGHNLNLSQLSCGPILLAL